MLGNVFLLSVDGCKNYTVLSEADRAHWYTFQYKVRRDDSLVTGWYRFQGAAGNRMLDKCVPRYRCGTEHPGWLNGTHPTVAEGVVIRNVCFSDGENCCTVRNIIKVKNCSTYYVYELQKPNAYAYYARYCGNAGAGKL